MCVCVCVCVCIKDLSVKPDSQNITSMVGIKKKKYFIA